MNYLKKCFRFFVKLYERPYYTKYYNSITELPVVNWFKVYEDNDLSQLSKTGKICKRAVLVLDKLQDEYIDTFGAPSEFMKVRRLKIKLELMYCKQVQTGDESNQFFIEMLEHEIAELEKRNTSKKSDVYDSIFYIQKWQGVHIPPDTLTVFMFYKYTKAIIKSVPKKNEK